ncbi:MAG: lysophospholipid acyltransferase family protein [Nanoarchaeota archaeon]
MIYPFADFFLGSLVRLFIRKVHGMENLPKPPFILAANHESYLDPFLIIATVTPKLNKQIHYLAMKGRFWNKFGEIISRKWAGCVPLDEGKDKAMAELISLLKKGEIIGIFPGGPRSLDGNLTKGKTGAVRLALAAKVPIIPIGLKGTYDIAPKDKIIPNLKRCELFFGKPIYYTRYYKKKLSNRSLHKLTDGLMRQIGKLINKKYLYSRRHS